MGISEIACSSWKYLSSYIENETLSAHSLGESLWFRGCSRPNRPLLPTLMRDTADFSEDDHDSFEQDVFFEFQARASDLRKLELTEWEYLFYGRHFDLPTRVLDWTDTLGVALYFALERWDRADPASRPTIWVINPCSLNEETWDVRDIVLPRYLGLIGKKYWDFGELLLGSGKWSWDGPVAIYPIQINERVRAQRGWFTIHGNDRRPVEEQFPELCTKLILEDGCVEEAKFFLQMAGFNRFSIYPDLSNLAHWIRTERLASMKIGSERN